MQANENLSTDFAFRTITLRSDEVRYDHIQHSLKWYLSKHSHSVFQSKKVSDNSNILLQYIDLSKLDILRDLISTKWRHWGKNLCTYL